MNRTIKKQLPSLVIAIFGMILLFLIPNQISEVQISNVGPRFFPYALSSIIVVLSLLSFVWGLRKSNLQTEAADQATDEEVQAEGLQEQQKPSYLRVVFTFIILILWLIFTPILGFSLTTVLTTAGAMFVIGSRKWYQLILVPLLFTSTVYYVFRVLLKVAFPESILF